MWQVHLALNRSCSSSGSGSSGSVASLVLNLAPGRQRRRALLFEHQIVVQLVACGLQATQGADVRGSGGRNPRDSGLLISSSTQLAAGQAAHWGQKNKSSTWGLMCGAGRVRGCLAGARASTSPSAGLCPCTASPPPTRACIGKAACTASRSRHLCRHWVAQAAQSRAAAAGAANTQPLKLRPQRGDCAPGLPAPRSALACLAAWMYAVVAAFLCKCPQHTQSMWLATEQAGSCRQAPAGPCPQARAISPARRAHRYVASWRSGALGLTLEEKPLQE